MQFMSRKSIGSIILLIIVASLICWFSILAVWLGDDLNYAYSFIPGLRMYRVQSLMDIIQSQNAHYFYVNGRYWAHVLVQYFCGIWGQPIFAVCNGIAYILFFLILFKLYGTSLSNFKSVASIVVLSLLSLQTKMVPSCQIGYIWTFAVTMCFIYIFFKTSSDSNPFRLILLALFSIFAGNGQEGINVGVSGALIIFWACNLKRLTLRQYVMLISFGIGALICCLSPGILQRAEGSSVNNGILGFILNRLYILIDLRATYILFAVMLWQRFKHKIAYKSIYLDNKFYWNTFFILLIFTFVVGSQGSNRQCLSIDLFAIIILIHMMESKSFTTSWLCVFSILLIWSYVWQSVELIDARQRFNDIEHQYAASPDGKVYVDLGLNKQYSIPPRSTFSLKPPIYGVAFQMGEVHENKTYGDLTFNELVLQRYLSTRYPGKPNLRIIPPMLKGLEHKTLSNQVIPLNKYVHLVIEDKTSSQHLNITRAISLPGIHRVYPSESVTDQLYPVAEGDTWRASYFSTEPYTIGYISTQNLSFK